MGLLTAIEKRHAASPKKGRKHAIPESLLDRCFRWFVLTFLPDSWAFRLLKDFGIRP